MTRYIAKKDTWFKEGTECFRQDEIYPAGVLFDSNGDTCGSAIYEGTYVVGSCNPDGYDKYWYDKGYKNGDEVTMREHCTDDEFELEDEA